jgi:hypothetical protein
MPNDSASVSDQQHSSVSEPLEVVCRRWFIAVLCSPFPALIGALHGLR